MLFKSTLLYIKICFEFEFINFEKGGKQYWKKQLKKAAEEITLFL